MILKCENCGRTMEIKTCIDPIQIAVIIDRAGWSTGFVEYDQFLEVYHIHDIIQCRDCTVETALDDGTEAMWEKLTGEQYNRILEGYNDDP